MLRLMDKPGAGRIYPDVEAVKASFGRGCLLLVTRRLTASRYLGVGREGEDSENEVRPHAPAGSTSQAPYMLYAKDEEPQPAE